MEITGMGPKVLGTNSTIRNNFQPYTKEGGYTYYHCPTNLKFKTGLDKVQKSNMVIKLMDKFSALNFEPSRISIEGRVHIDSLTNFIAAIKANQELYSNLQLFTELSRVESEINGTEQRALLLGLKVIEGKKSIEFDEKKMEFTLGSKIGGESLSKFLSNLKMDVFLNMEALLNRIVNCPNAIEYLNSIAFAHPITYLYNKEELPADVTPVNKLLISLFKQSVQLPEKEKREWVKLLDLEGFELKINHPQPDTMSYKFVKYTPAPGTIGKIWIRLRIYFDKDPNISGTKFTHISEILKECVFHPKYLQVVSLKSKTPEDGGKFSRPRPYWDLADDDID